ncbi:MAG: hypothetical protein ACYC49_08210 [Ignavibacteriaceae bacterium]
MWRVCVKKELGKDFIMAIKTNGKIVLNKKDKLNNASDLTEKKLWTVQEEAF